MDKSHAKEPIFNVGYPNMQVIDFPTPNKFDTDLIQPIISVQ